MIDEIRITLNRPRTRLTFIRDGRRIRVMRGRRLIDIIYRKLSPEVVRDYLEMRLNEERGERLL